MLYVSVISPEASLYEGDATSVVVPAFNASVVIADALHSVLQQRYTSFEVIVALRRNPLTRSRPATSVSSSCSSGHAEPQAIFAVSAVSGPICSRTSEST